ncbi:DUF1761 domain-containing protein [Candidatus Woesebacteria bacterium]|nr:DUF1761 domain-containing protein [Candidatus Woesebacteria bacterium]
MTLSFFSILLCGVFSMILGFVWYGPLFGKKWMEIIGTSNQSEEARKKMQKEAGPLYLVSFLLALFEAWVLAMFNEGVATYYAISNAFWIWLAFIVPALAGSVMWTNEKPVIKKSRFLIQTGYQLLLLVGFALIISLLN